MCLCTWQLFVAQAEQLPGALLAAPGATQPDPRPACLLGTRVTTSIAPNCPTPSTNTLPRALLADPLLCRSAARGCAQTARNPREADSSNAIRVRFRPRLLDNCKEDVSSSLQSLQLSGSQYLVSSCSGTTVPKELDTRRRARDAIFLTGTGILEPRYYSILNQLAASTGCQL